MNKNVMMAAALVSGLAMSATAHDARRLEIKVVDNQLVAHGYISNGVDDMGGVIRPYYNAIHGHWSNNPSPSIDAASTDLPGFDVFAGSPLVGHNVEIELLGARMWEAPPPMPPAGTEVNLVAADGEIFVSFGSETVTSAAPGSFTLVDSVGAGGALDIDLNYDIASRPSGVLYVLDFRLSTDAVGVAASDTVHVILSPDGNGPMEKLHHAALYLETVLGTPVPTPGAAGVLGLAGLVAARRRR